MGYVTGERVSTAEGGFNPSFQKHRAIYRMCAELLPPGRVLDLGCGTGHSYRELDPRETVGVDIDASALEGQDRETHVADMRDLPFPDASFDAVVSVQSIEHVPNADRVLAEVARVLRPGGRAIFATPNRLTFGRPDEIIDPFHYVEYDGRQLASLCRRQFAEVEVRGVHGSSSYMAIHDGEREDLARLLAMDPLRLRRLVPRRALQLLYDRRLNADRAQPRRGALEISPEDFSLSDADLDDSLDLVAICDLPMPSARRTPAEDAKVIVVMPALNAAATLEATFRAIPLEVVDNVILVDDRSSDDTQEVARTLPLELIWHPHNVGYGGNQKTCYLWALQQGADVVVMLHPDGQYEPELIPRMIEPILAGEADMVLGSRFAVSGMALAGGMPRYKYLLNRAMTTVENWALGTSLSELHTGYRAYSRELLMTIPFLRNSIDFVFDSEVLFQTVHFGFRIAEVPARSRYFDDASSIKLRPAAVYGLKTMRFAAIFVLHRRGVLRSRKLLP